MSASVGEIFILYLLWSTGILQFGVFFGVFMLLTLHCFCCFITVLTHDVIVSDKCCEAWRAICCHQADLCAVCFQAGM